MAIRIRKLHIAAYAIVSWTFSFLIIHQWAASTTNLHDNVVQNNLSFLATPTLVQEVHGDPQSKDHRHGRRLPESSIRHDLETLNLTFFVYEDSDLLLQNATNFIRHPKKRLNSTVHKRRILIERYRQDALIEVDILNRFRNYTGRLRVYDPMEASVILVPIPVGVGLARQGQRKKHSAFKLKPSSFHPLRDAFDALMAKPTFQKLRGHRHVLISLTQPAFDYSNEAHTSHAGLSRNQYQLFENVTIAREVDPFACANLTVHYPDNSHDFAGLFAEKLPTTKHAFSIGLGSGVGFPFIPASWDKFQQASNFLFYQTRRDEPFAHNSTVYRHALMSDPTLATALPRPFSVGFGIDNRTEWFQKFMDSKFCLVVRGDTPHSHALMRSIQVGCLPVVVSDYYSLYAPTFASTLNLQDFVIFIREESFLRAPVQELINMQQQISQTQLRRKIEALKLAQQVLVYNHPQSLFIPAFLKESFLAMHRDNPELVPTIYGLKEQYLGAREIRERRQKM